MKSNSGKTLFGMTLTWKEPMSPLREWLLITKEVYRSRAPEQGEKRLFSSETPADKALSVVRFIVLGVWQDTEAKQPMPFVAAMELSRYASNVCSAHPPAVRSQ